MMRNVQSLTNQRDDARSNGDQAPDGEAETGANLEETVEQLEEANRQLKQSNNRLEQFASAAAHDLQEPLRMVSSYLQLIENRSDGELSEETEEFLEYATDGADRMRAMIDGLLTYARVDTEGAISGRVDLNDVVSDVHTDLQVQISDSDADVEIQDLPRVAGDKTLLYQLFQNLMKNAITYAGDDPPCIGISAERNSTEWIVSVQDDGIGIDPADQEAIFDLFHCLHPSGNSDGSGIGLALCERIAECHSGEIWVESEPGEGTTFSVTLPAAGACDD